jgi:hypothetical protein
MSKIFSTKAKKLFINNIFFLDKKLTLLLLIKVLPTGKNSGHKAQKYLHKNQGRLFSRFTKVNRRKQKLFCAKRDNNTITLNET